MGISPDLIVLRSDEPLRPEIFRKISMFCNVKPDCVIENLTLSSLYEAPLMLEQQNFSGVVCRALSLDVPEPELNEWRAMVERVKNPTRRVTVGLVGKYVQLHDAYLSVAEALRHAAYAQSARVDIRWISSDGLTSETVADALSDCEALVIPGGFGDRGIDGMVVAARYARERDIPLLGICLGMQIEVIEFARNVCGLPDADSGEFQPQCAHKVIDLLPGQESVTDKGASLRLGAWPCATAAGSLLRRCYGKELISERHRHRYEFNGDYAELLGKNGLSFCGLSPDGRIVEAVELPDKRFYVGVQFHPEFKSRPNRPHPLFYGLIEEALRESEE